MKVYRMVMMFIDFDDLGPEQAVEVIENARLPNHIIPPQCMELQEREVEWSDDHPLNRGDDERATAFDALFGNGSDD